MKKTPQLFDHFIITRFNLRKKEWTTSRSNSLVLTDEWLTNRMQLFETYCLPSVLGQRNTNFKWLVYFDTTTPDPVKERITAICNENPLFQPRFCDGMDAFLPSIQSDLGQSDAPYIITTRLDNDDCIAHNFVELVQQRFDSQSYLALDFVKGWTLRLENPCQLGIKIHAFNPFMSLIESNKNPETIWSKGHTEWKREKRLDQNTTEAAWMSIIHSENKINDFTGFGNCNVQETLNHFTILETEKKRILKEALNPSDWKITNLRNKLDSYYKFYSKELKKKLNWY
jgi:hypothetical protein